MDIWRIIKLQLHLQLLTTVLFRMAIKYVSSVSVPKFKLLENVLHSSQLRVVGLSFIYNSQDIL